MVTRSPAPAPAAGIDVTGRTDVSIFGGTIRNFEAGVLTSTVDRDRDQTERIRGERRRHRSAGRQQREHDQEQRLPGTTARGGS